MKHLPLFKVSSSRPAPRHSTPAVHGASRGLLLPSGQLPLLGMRPRLCASVFQAAHCAEAPVVTLACKAGPGLRTMPSRAGARLPSM